MKFSKKNKSSASDEDELARWNKAMDLMHEGIKKMFCNDFSGAEEVFLEGMKLKRSDMEIEDESAQEESAALDNDEEEDENDDDIIDGDVLKKRDLRGAFALNYAIVSVLRGIASLSDDQLAECESRLWEAKALAEKDTNWIGRRVVVGVAQLTAGIVQVLQQKFVRGVWNILRSFQYIKSLKKKALPYKGVGAEVVRSSALYTLGNFNMIISVLPPSMMKAASWMTGFDGSREKGLQQMIQCRQEGGILAGAAGLGVLTFLLDTKTFLGDVQTPEDFKVAREILDWASEKYPNSFVYAIVEADYWSCQTQPEKAREIMQSFENADFLIELKALRWVQAYKSGLLCLTAFDYSGAAEEFKKSFQVYREVGRRSMVPFMAIYAALCYYTAGEMESGDEMLAVVEEYKAMKKKNWGRQDQFAFRTLASYQEDEGGKSPSRSFLLLCASMCFRMRLTMWLNADGLNTLLEKIKECGRVVADENDDDDEVSSAALVAMLSLLRSDIYIAGKRYDDAIAACEEAIAVEADALKHPKTKTEGVVPLIVYQKAYALYLQKDVLGSKHVLTKMSSYGSHELQKALKFKCTQLKRSIGVEITAGYEKLSVGARKDEKVAFQVTNEMCKTVQWEFSVEAHSIGYCVEFNGEVVAASERVEASTGVVTGEHNVSCDGEFSITFINSFSWMRGKTVRYRVSPDFLEKV